MTDIGYRFLYHPEEKHFLKAVGVTVDGIPENSVIIPPRIINSSWSGHEPDKRFLDLEIDYYHPAAGNVYQQIASGAYLPGFFGNDPKPEDCLVNNYWNGEDWELRNTPLGISIAKENPIVESLLNDFFLVEKIEREKTYYVLIHKIDGYETLVRNDDVQWNKELYGFDVRSIIDFIEYNFEISETNAPPSANVYYYTFAADGSYSGAIEASLSYDGERWPNPIPDGATEIPPPFSLKPPLNSTYFHWNGSGWEIRNTEVAKRIAMENAIAAGLLADGYMLVDRKKSLFKDIKIGHWYILWKQEGDSYTIVHSMDKEFFREDFSTYEHAIFEINAIEHENIDASPETPITQEEIQESQDRWARYEQEQKEIIKQTKESELSALPQQIIEDWEGKKQDAEYWKEYYIQNMKVMIDRNFEEDKIFYEFKARIAREMKNEKT